MKIVRLDCERYRGLKYSAEVRSDRFLSIEPVDDGFEMKWVRSQSEIRHPISDVMLSRSG